MNESLEKSLSSHLSEREKKMGELVEALPVSDPNKVDILLVLKGLKRATDVGIAVKIWQPGETPTQIPPEIEEIILKEAENTFNSLGLKFIRGQRKQPEPFTYKIESGKEIISGGADWQEYYIARSTEDADKFARVWEAEDEKESCDEIGRMSGYPESAIRAYHQLRYSGGEDKSAVMDQETLPEEIRNQDFMAFAGLRLSRDNWQQELESVKKWAEEIKGANPELYERTVEDYRKNLTESQN